MGRLSDLRAPDSTSSRWTFWRGPLSLHGLLTAGLVGILFLSFLLSAVGVAVLVRRYLWRSGVEDLQSVMRPVERFLEGRPEGRPGDPNDGRRPWPRGDRPGSNGRDRGFRRFNQARGEVFLLRDGVVVRGSEEGENTWGRSFDGLADGVHLLDHEKDRWQVLSRRVKDDEYDQVVVARRWSPYLRIVRMLIAYQVLTMTLVLGLAVLAVRFLARRIVMPLEELGSWTERIGETRLENLSPSKIAEVSSLQSSFSTMGERVQGALEAQRRFVADASHELKTPLTAISGMLELLESRPEMSPEDRQQAMSVAKTEASRMANLVSDLLVLSRAQARRSGKKEPRALAPLVEEQLGTMRLVFPGQEFHSLLDVEAVWSVNPDAFARIVRNLVENAAHHAGGKPIEVKLSRRAGEITLQVIDRGPGIDADKLPRLFQRFYRMDEGRSREQGGFGLGLAIVKALVEEMGGQLICESVMGQGSCFGVLFKKT